eukprot:g2121.t1
MKSLRTRPRRKSLTKSHYNCNGRSRYHTSIRKRLSQKNSVRFPLKTLNSKLDWSTYLDSYHFGDHENITTYLNTSHTWQRRLSHESKKMDEDTTLSHPTIPMTSSSHPKKSSPRHVSAHSPKKANVTNNDLFESDDSDSDNDSSEQISLPYALPPQKENKYSNTSGESKKKETRNYSNDQNKNRKCINISQHSLDMEVLGFRWWDDLRTILNENKEKTETFVAQKIENLETSEMDRSKTSMISVRNLELLFERLESQKQTLCLIARLQSKINGMPSKQKNQERKTKTKTNKTNKKNNKKKKKQQVKSSTTTMQHCHYVILMPRRRNDTNMKVTQQKPEKNLIEKKGKEKVTKKVTEQSNSGSTQKKNTSHTTEIEMHVLPSMRCIAIG